jgi:lipopolysaccharide transport system ATP-binding protein
MIAISCENLSKRFVIRHQQQAGNYSALRDVITDGVKNIIRKRERPTSEEFWALKDVTFSIAQGDRVGIIGRNGAGKSTLLKILSRITEPSDGRVRIKGRVASLLEVGTGFHPELTGRENIFLNGSILGMSRAEIRKKFDEIVDFAEVEKFLDTPVKRYSSGMYVRLAFAVAAHLEPEILVVDEVLAVGDAQFQEKCLGKMRQVSGEGRTVIFVSHNMASIEQLCNKAIWLHHGQLRESGDTAQIIDSYLRFKNVEAATSTLTERKDRSGSGKARFESIQLLDHTGTPIEKVKSGARCYLSIKLKEIEPLDEKQLIIAVGIDNSRASRIGLLSNSMTGERPSLQRQNGCAELKIVVDEIPFAAGNYPYTLFMSDSNGIIDWIQNAGMIEVEPGDFFKTGRLLPSGQGDFLIRHSFQ